MPFLFKKYALLFGGKGAGVVVLPPQFIKMAPFKKAKIPKQPGEFGWSTRLSYEKLYTVHIQKTRFFEHLKIGDLDPEMAASYAGLRFWMTYA